MTLDPTQTASPKFVLTMHGSKAIAIGAIIALSGAEAFTAPFVPALRKAQKSEITSVKMNNPFGGLFGGGDKKEAKKDDLEDAIDDWKEIGFDIDEVLADQEKGDKKDAKKDGKK